MSAASDRPVALTKQHHARALAARERKREEASARGIDDAYIAGFVEAFYARIRGDALLGPIFAARITDWPLHLERMKTFWRSILLGSGEYSGNPMERHLALTGVGRDHFAHWLELFHATLRDLEPSAEATAETAQRARMIADSLLTAIAMRDEGLAGARAGESLPRL